MFNILRHQTDLGATVIIIAVLIRIDFLAVMCTTNVFNVCFQPAVGEETATARRCSSRSRQSPSAFGNVCQKLGDLERITLLLQVLIVTGGKIRLCCLLFQTTCANLCLRPLQCRCLRPSANTSQLISSPQLLLISLLPKTCKLLPCLQLTGQI